MHLLMLALALLPLLAAEPPQPDRLDALDFTNGTLLVADPGSYSPGVREWSTWALTDGSDALGWCSVEGKPTGATFVWELDSTWRLDTLALSTKNLQESSYPGITARKVELSVASASGAWKSLGVFEIGKETRREYPLPKGTEAGRVKLVILANHGNDDYTELTEADLFGQRVGSVPTRKIEGVYNTTFRALRFVQEGDQVSGCYDWGGGGYVWGTVTGRVAQVIWSEPNSDQHQGVAVFSMRSPDAFSGVWFEKGDLKGAWDGTRVPPAQGPKCQPLRKGRMADALKRSKKAVLYGIRFGSGLDVPLPESAATLEELAAALKQTPGLVFEISGHTDNLAPAGYNLDLSNRRARAIVAALVKAGVPGPRLTARGYGLTRPVADNATAQGRALNRRVEVAVVK